LSVRTDGLGQQLIERRTALQPLAEFIGLGAQRRIAQRLDARLERVRSADKVRVAAKHPVVAAAEDALEKLEH
jgi:hypothetical protein